MNLIEDFCKRCNIHMLELAIERSFKKINQSFNRSLIEGINCANYYGMNIVNPHEKNDILHHLSLMMSTEFEESKLMVEMRNYVDSYFFKENLKFVEIYQLESNYFTPCKFIKKSEILEIIKLEEQYRINNALDVVEKYQQLSATLAKPCIESLSDS